ncbi:AAA family ATPase [Anaerobranca gottschalkii]|uniref:Nuclease SbcCD subunit C n=1 Tax=Anaerobranca gottschalkii DSM 13577 TaxID=1120990 RepID=A0A1H9Z2Q5_9FIRM|nr:AAA family ATPase [Anaerobranca gottschalkii]SES75670.1 Wobble nucleotide-excising tRNase [Anaerobranca gottschalkii DSM 13577]
MIKKIKKIDGFGVYNNFLWDSTVLDNENSQPLCFNKVNIIYGRNYSGKTTLSRIIRSFETSFLDSKYDSSTFSLEMDNGTILTQEDLHQKDFHFRVFNKDFVIDNLKFIVDPNEKIKAFAVFGEENVRLEKEIRELKNKLGSNEKDKESGLYHLLKEAKINEEKEKNKLKDEKEKLENRLRDKATDPSTGIRYNVEKFGDQNYDIRKIRKELELVLSDNYRALTPEEKNKYEAIVNEKGKPPISELPKINLLFDSFCDEAQVLLSKQIGESDKIQELLNDYALNKWVKEGVGLLKGKKQCAFCGSEITDERWESLKKHFDDESQKLESDIKNLIDRIENHKNEINNGFIWKEEDFYVNFLQQLETLKTKYNDVANKYLKHLDAIREQLRERLTVITKKIEFIRPCDNKNDFDAILNECKSFKNEVNEYCASNRNHIKDAQEKLRLFEVYSFARDIGYEDICKKIKDLEETCTKAEEETKRLQKNIEDIKEEIKKKENLLSSEQNAADKINYYLDKYFGHKYLTLKAVEDDSTNEKSVYFEVHRNDDIAFNLSEGECNLIAFCYFMAKLEDVKTAGQKPIIWIDDPVSSLDDDNIFYMYSLISEITKKELYTQLVISTHNLEFLKYLRRLKPNKKGYWIIRRTGENSVIKPMPKHLVKYGTEFNYLFSCIYKCSQLNENDDDNYEIIYNFGNNARKFLEVYLYYKYPYIDEREYNLEERLERFFAGDSLIAEKVNRVVNERSHLQMIERGLIPFDKKKEIISVAKHIIDKVNEDNEQYQELLNSIS